MAKFVSGLRNGRIGAVFRLGSPRKVRPRPAPFTAISKLCDRSFLDAFARALPADQHAIMVLDQAGWHGAKALRVPDAVTLVPLPPYGPELNPVERVWLYLREGFLSHRVLDGYAEIVAACCQAWNALTPERLRSLTHQP